MVLHDAQVGPDGHVWVIDWYNFIVQHNPTPAGYETGRGNAYETPLRDKQHGEWKAEYLREEQIELVEWPAGHPYGLTAADLLDDASDTQGASRS